MSNFICITCGTQFAETPDPPNRCPICADERQYIGHDGQRWTTLPDLSRELRNVVEPIASGLTGFTTDPRFAIGQQAHLIETAAGSVLWNCLSLIDDATIDEVSRRGGLAAIAISHPHFYTSMVDWSRAFGGVPIYLHAEDRNWVMRPADEIRFWTGEAVDLLPGGGLTLIRCGGHFPGSCVLHWAAGASGRGALFTGDTIMVVADRRWVSFMYSYPNLIPVDAASVHRIVAAVEHYPFDRIYGGWQGSIVATDGKDAVRRSADRYLTRIGGSESPGT